MQQTVYPAQKLVGEVQVPGYLDGAARALSLAVLSTEESLIDNVPPQIDALAVFWRRLGVQIERQKSRLKVQGPGLKKFVPVEDILDAEVLGEEIIPLVALLSVQAFPTRLKVHIELERCRQLVSLLSVIGVIAGEEIEGVFVLGGKTDIAAADLGMVDTDVVIRLALMITALGVQEQITWREPAKTKERIERCLISIGAQIVRRRDKTSGEYSLICSRDQQVKPQQIKIGGDLGLALPLIIAALGLKGSKLRLRQLALGAGKRTVLDLLRQVGAKVTIEDEDDGKSDIVVEGSEVKATRVAGKRAEKVLGQVALLAVLATQSQGEFVLRDIAVLRKGTFDYISHLVAILRMMGAKVGEFPEGLVVKGGHPLKGAQIDTKGDLGLTFAFAVAALWAAGETTLGTVESAQLVYPDFFTVLESLKKRS